jgi:predicted MFS family arabinose efflux permease
MPVADAAVTVRSWRLTAAGLALIAVCYGLARFTYGIFVPAFRSAFELSGTLLGTIAAGSYVGYCAAILVTAIAVPRFGPRTVATAAGAVAVAGMTMVAVAPNGAVLAVGVLVAGASTGVASPPLAEVIARWVPVPAQDRAQAVVNAGSGAGIAVSVPVVLLALGHWRLAWGLFAVIAATVTVWVMAAVPAAPAARGPAETLFSGMTAVVGDRRSRPLITGATIFGAASTAVWTFGRDHVVQAGGLGDTASTLLWAVLGMAEIAGVVSGALAARHGLRRVWMAGLVLLASATLALGLFPQLSTLAFAAAALFGASYIILTTIVLFWATRLHPGHTAAAVALGFLMIAVGQALASPAVGVLADRTGTAGVFVFCALLAALGMLSSPRNLE